MSQSLQKLSQIDNKLDFIPNDGWQKVSIEYSTFTQITD